MKAAIEEPLPRGFSGPAASVLVALAGAAIVVAGLLLVGVRSSKAAEWNPSVSFDLGRGGLVPLPLVTACVEKGGGSL
jgi:hypothetical protein